MKIWFTVNKDGSEWIWQIKPIREDDYWLCKYGNKMLLPHGAIEKLTGKKISWKDNPLMYEFNVK